MIRLDESFGVHGNALLWQQTPQSNTVRTGQSSSSAIPLSSGAPQGLVLEPILFSAYISPLCHIITNHSLHHQQYADDLQLFISLSATDLSSSSSNLVYLIFTTGYLIHYWYSLLCLNGLCLNPDKSEVILLGNRQRLKKFPAPSSVIVANNLSGVSDKIIIFGIAANCHLSMGYTGFLYMQSWLLSHQCHKTQ